MTKFLVTDKNKREIYLKTSSKTLNKDVFRSQLSQSSLKYKKNVIFDGIKTDKDIKNKNTRGNFILKSNILIRESFSRKNKKCMTKIGLTLIPDLSFLSSAT